MSRAPPIQKCAKLREEDSSRPALNYLRFAMKIVMRKMTSWIWRDVWIVLGVLLFCREFAFAQQYNGKELVKASLISDAKAIQPGQKFRVGILYKIEPGWHVYWKYSEDSGVPTKVEWRLPPGFKVQDLKWPLPLPGQESGRLAPSASA